MMASSAALRSSLVMGSHSLQGRGRRLKRRLRDNRYQAPLRKRRREARTCTLKSEGCGTRCRPKNRLTTGHKTTPRGHAVIVPSQKRGAIRRPANTKTGSRASSLILGVDAEGARFVEGDVEGFGFFNDDFAELLFLGEEDRLELDHFEDGKEGHDHGVAGGAGFEELHEAYGIVGAGEDLTPQLGNHLRDGELFMLELNAGDFFFALEELLEDTDEVDKGNNEFAFSAFVVIKGFVGFGPDVFFDLLLLVEELGGVFELFVFDEALYEFFTRVGDLLFWRGQGIGREKHFGFDVDESGGHVDEFGGHVDVELFELVEVVEVLGGVCGDLDVVNVHFLLFDE